MDHKALFMKHWEKEAPATKKVISRIPHDKSEHRPDPKARTARELAWLIVREEAALADGLEKGSIEWVDVPAPAHVKDVIAEYERTHDSITKRMHAIPAANWEKMVAFVYGGQKVAEDTAFETAWGFLHDQIHHRGQLSTYLRPMGAKVPAIYGPSADESQ